MIAESSRSILIVGTGAMACLFAAKLSAAGIRVFISGTWIEGLQALRMNGVRLVNENEEEQVFPVHVLSQDDEHIGFQNALVLVKSWQTERAALQLVDLLANDGLALTLQNGAGNIETLSHFLGASRAALGVTTIGATLLGPGKVRQAGAGAILVSDHPRSQSLLELLSSAGFSVQIEPDPTSVLWGKLVINVAINPLTAIINIPNGELLARNSARYLLQKAAQEAASVAVAKSIQLPYSDPVAMVEATASKTAANRSSMLQDVLRGAPTEVDSICGAIVQAGDEIGVSTPIIRTLWHLVKALRPEEK